MASSSPSLAHLLPPSSSSSNPFDPSTRLLTPTTNPIPLLPNANTKQYARYIHTPLVMLYYYMRSRSLIDDPVNTMIFDAFVLAIFQSFFVTACVPYVGVWDSGDAIQGTKGVSGAGISATGSGASVSMGSGSVRKRHGAPGGGGLSGRVGSGRSEPNLAVPHWKSRISPLLLSLTLTLTFPPIPITLLALCLGAPLYPISSIPHTFILSIHVSLLSFLPIFYSHGVSPQSWRDVTAAWLPFDNAGIWAGSVGCFIGGWIGAVPMALDWDRDWQAWPCTVLWGCVLGWGVGRVLTSTLRLGVGKRIDLSEKPSLPESVLGRVGGGGGASAVKIADEVGDKKASIKKIEADDGLTAEEDAAAGTTTLSTEAAPEPSSAISPPVKSTSATTPAKTTSSTPKSAGSKGKKSS